MPDIYKKYVECDCELGNEATIPAPDNDLLCVGCYQMLRDHGWCAAQAARLRKLYGENWTPAQASVQRQQNGRQSENIWKPRK